MSARPDKTNAGGSCLARSVARTLVENPGLEAVTIDRNRHTIALATLGRTENSAAGAIQATFETAEADAAKTSCTLLAGTGDCLTCPHPLEEGDRQRIRITHTGDSTTIARITCPTAPKFWRWRDIPWPKVVPREMELAPDEASLDEWRGQLIAAIACGVFALAGYFLKGHEWMGTWAFLLAYLCGSWHTSLEIIERLRKRTIDVHFLMLAVAIGSASIGAWAEGAMLLFLFSFSGALEHYALGRTQREIRALFRDAPTVGIVLDAKGQEVEVPVEKLRPGMRLLVRPGSLFPVDGKITAGRTASDESNLTGEAAPVEKTLGERVFAGTMNIWGVVEVEVLKSAAESSLAKIIHLIQYAQQQKAPSQQFTDKFSAWYTYAVLLTSAGMFFVWWLALGDPPFKGPVASATAFYKAMTLLVVASPCALVLSIPSAVLAAIAWGARHGILFRGGAAVEKLAEITGVGLDKTGTLTTGELTVQEVETFPEGREQELATLAYSVERFSTHPLAKAIARYAQARNLKPLPVEGFESITGEGVTAVCQNQPLFAGKRGWVLHSVGEALPSRPETGLSEVWIARGDLLGRMVLRDEIRSASRQVIQTLKSQGIKTLMLTGDHASSANYIGATLAMDEIKSELKPEQKLEEIHALTRAGHKVAMIGDGVNDAPSLAAAHIGIAMGARGSDAALEQADVVLMNDKLENFLAALKLSQRARRVIRQNLMISLGTVCVLVAFAMAGKVPLTLGVLGHEGSTVLVVMNSLRLLFGSSKSHRAAI